LVSSNICLDEMSATRIGWYQTIVGAVGRRPPAFSLRELTLAIVAILWVGSASAEFQTLDPQEVLPPSYLADLTDLTDLARFTPNLEIDLALNMPNPTFLIRGVGLKDYNTAATGSVGIYHDGINLNSPAIQLGQNFDLGGIEVLRGAQGSLNAHNSTAGAILFRSAMPTGDFGVSTSLTYGNYDDKEVEAAINIPLIEDMLSMRVSGRARWRDGYTKNQCAGWNPEAYGFRRNDEQTNVDLYNALQPAGQYENGVLREALVKRQNNANVISSMVFLDEGLAREVRPYTSGANPGSTNNPFVLAEDLFDEGGALVAAAGTPIAKQSISFAIDEVDGICIVSSPGNVETLQGAFDNPGDIEGTWNADRIQPGLEDFQGLNKWTNNIDNWAARAIFLYEPLDYLDFMFNLHGTQNRGDSSHLQMIGATAKFEKLGFDEKLESGFSEENSARTSGWRLNEGSRNVGGVDNTGAPGQGGGNPFVGFYDKDGLEVIDAWGVNGKGFLDLDFATVTLLYDYEWYDRVVEDEGDANPKRLFPAIWSDSAWQTTEELRIEGEGERYKWTTGFFFLYEELTATNDFPDTQQFSIKQNFDQQLTSGALYAAGEIDLVEEGAIPGIYALTLNAGLRYNQEKKEFTLSSSAVGTTSNVEVVELPAELKKATWKEWTGDVKLSYTPFSNEYGHMLTYFSYGHGFKGGHFNAGLTITGGNTGAEQNIDPVDPEFIDAIEFGVRSRWFDDKVTLNAAVFRYWYQGLQVFDITNEAGKLPIQKLLNGDADVLGAELELIIRPIPGWNIRGNLGWLDSEFSEFTVTKTIPQRRGSPAPAEFNYAGNSLVAAPNWNWSVITDYEIPLFGWGYLIPQYDFNYRSKGYLDPQMIDPISQDGYWLHNLQIAYRTPDERIQLAFWVSNIFEEEYKVDVFDLTRQYDTILEVWGEPRTYGVTLSLNW
jgi:outer membrane receptor protein involved in Fe transport